MSHESERVTRRGRIDPKLKTAGWEVAPATSQSSPSIGGLAVEEFETPIGPADYALFDGGRCLGVVRDTPVPLPPLEEQREIVRRGAELSALAGALGQRIEATSERIARTSQAVLAKAFRGDLGSDEDTG